MKINKQKLPLYIALAIPMLMIVLIALFVYIPGIGKKPHINFLYVSGQGYYSNYNYAVSGGKLIMNTFTSTDPVYKGIVTTPHIYLYDVSTDKATELAFQDAQKYTLDASTESSEGFAFRRGGYSGGFLFDVGNDYNSYYLVGFNRKHKLNLKTVGTGYDDNQFLGWIIKD